MKLSFKVKTLRDAIAALQPVTSGRKNSTLPDLMGVKFHDAGGDKVCVSGTNLDIWYSITIEAEEGASFADFIVPSARLSQAVAGMDGICELVESEPGLLLRDGRSNIRLPKIETEPAKPASGELGKPFTITSAALAAAIPFASDEKTRPNLCGVHFGAGRLEASTGQILATVEAPCSVGGIVPTELCRLAVRAGDEIQCRFSENLVEFSGDNWVIAGRLIAGNFPGVEPLLKRSDKTTIKAPVDEILQAAEYAMIGQKGVFIKISASKDSLTFCGNEKTDTPAERKIKAEVKNPFTFGLSTANLKRTLSPMKGEVEIWMEDEMSPLTIKQDGILAICMPARVA